MASLLVDEGIGQDLVQALASQGFAIFHVLEFLPKGAKDSLVFLEAQTRSLTIFTWNRDDFVLRGTLGVTGDTAIITVLSRARKDYRSSILRKHSPFWNVIAAIPHRS